MSVTKCTNYSVGPYVSCADALLPPVYRIFPNVSTAANKNHIFLHVEHTTRTVSPPEKTIAHPASQPTYPLTNRVSLDSFGPTIFRDTPFFNAGGWNAANCQVGLGNDRYDALIFGRRVICSPGLPSRLKEGLPPRMYERDRFYGQFLDRERGYTELIILLGLRRRLIKMGKPSL
ncbi:hypothetical protein EJ08DRAFT_256936 [Tothia fuscella]|uniref:Uncharacterized protein n=1 Tax=Tothia fuscella TaxID=1048955 RepID=A0A9P4TXU2_9PEZI|nr:hypothetical protein EJ08DRAFT_256936 [Tothia fuscella]